jgi:tetratricopeptide (TPR) repeat protein
VLVALHPDMTNNAHLGLTEELFLVLFLTLLTIFLYSEGLQRITWWQYSLIGGLGGVMAMVRPDSAYAVIPMFLATVWKERHNGVHRIAMTLPVILLPFALPILCQWWMEGLGLQNMGMRMGRSILWMEFMFGRMPYQYMFYRETSLSDWMFGHHTFGHLISIGIKSSVRNFLVLGESTGGQVAFSVAILGAIAYLRQRREWVLPLAVPLAVLPQWGLMSLWPEGDVGRYNLRVVPLVFIFLLIGATQIADWTRTRVILSDPWAQWLPTGLLILALSPALLPFSIYSSVRPAVDILMHERAQYPAKVSKVHADLVAMWNEMASQRVSLAEATEVTKALRQHHEAYAPTHFALGVLHMQQGQLAQAMASLERALEHVPFFAEAAVLLAELYMVEQRRDDALTLLQRTQVLRPDYPLIALLRGHLHISAGDIDNARRDYEEYLRLNRYQHGRASIRHQRIMKRLGKGLDEESIRQLQSGQQAGLMTPFLWSYLSLDLNGIAMPRPLDDTIYFNLGVCDLRAGDAAAALQHWGAMTRLVPTHPGAWANLGTLQASLGRADEAKQSWQHALALTPQQAQARQGQQQLATGAFDTTTPNYAQIEIVLPMTRRRL